MPRTAFAAKNAQQRAREQGVAFTGETPEQIAARFPRAGLLSLAQTVASDWTSQAKQEAGDCAAEILITGGSEVEARAILAPHVT